LGITDYYSVDTYKKVLRKKREGHLSGVDLKIGTIQIGKPFHGWLETAIQLLGSVHYVPLF